MKAYLCEKGSSFVKTHDLVTLLNAVIGLDRSWALLAPAARILSDYAVRYRYPGASASRRQAKSAYEHCKLVRDFSRLGLGLTSNTRARPSTRKKRRARTKSIAVNRRNAS